MFLRGEAESGSSSRLGTFGSLPVTEATCDPLKRFPGAKMSVFNASLP